MSGPIKPRELLSAKKIPEEVYEALNELIAEDFNGIEATVRQSCVIARILDKMPFATKQEIFSGRWLNIEKDYRDNGWKVVYDKPAYDETFEAFFTFKVGP